MSVSRLEQMRSQFQQNLQLRSGLPRPTRIPGPAAAPAPPAAKAQPPLGGKQTASPRANGHGPAAGSEPASRAATVNGKVPNGGPHKDVTSLRNGTRNGGTSLHPSNGYSPGSSTAANGTRPHSSPSQRPLPPVAKGGVLMTMTTTQLRQLANGHLNGCGAAAAAKPLSSTPPPRVASSAVRTVPSSTLSPASPRVASSVARNPTPTSNGRAPTVARSPAKVVSLEQPKKPASRQPATPNGVVPAFQRAAVKAPPPEARPLGPNQERCDICGRGFNKDRIEKHRGVCQKAASKKVKVFDATKMRTKGTEAEAFVKKGFHKKEVPVKKPNWRAKHEEFLSAIRQARMVQEHLAAGGKLADLPPPPPSENPDYVQCPKCLRKFNETAAERHIPRCNLAPKTTAAPRKPATLNGRK